MVFNRLAARGLLPRGCPAGTCANLYASQWYDWFVLAENLTRTFIIGAIALSVTVSVMGLLCYCCNSGREVDEDCLQEVKCPEGHALTTFLTPNHTFECDDCGKKV